MKRNLKSVKETKEKLNIKPQSSACEELQSEQAKEKNVKYVSKLKNTGLREQVLKFSEKLERMIEQKHKEEVDAMKDKHLLDKLRQMKEHRLKKKQIENNMLSQFGSYQRKEDLDYNFIQ